MIIVSCKGWVPGKLAYNAKHLSRAKATRRRKDGKKTLETQQRFAPFRENSFSKEVPRVLFVQSHSNSRRRNKHALRSGCGNQQISAYFCGLRAQKRLNIQKTEGYSTILKLSH